MIYCKDCAHCIFDGSFKGLKSLEYSRCARTLKVTESPIHPELRVEEMSYCDTERRQYAPLDGCGPDAKYFVQKTIVSGSCP